MPDAGSDMSHPYEQVSLQLPGGGSNLISREEFQKTPLDQRVDLIMSGKVQFLKDGKVVPVTQAMKRPKPK